jgi:phage terminase small subunit
LADRVIGSTVVEIRADSSKLDAGLAEAKWKVEAAAASTGTAATQGTTKSFQKSLGAVNELRQALTYTAASVGLITAAAEGLWRMLGKAWADARTAGLPALDAVYNKMNEIRAEATKIGQALDDSLNPPDAFENLDRQIEALKKKAASAGTAFTDATQEKSGGIGWVFSKTYDAITGLDKVQQATLDGNRRAAQGAASAAIRELEARREAYSLKVAEIEAAKKAKDDAEQQNRDEVYQAHRMQATWMDEVAAAKEAADIRKRSAEEFASIMRQSALETTNAVNSINASLSGDRIAAGIAGLTAALDSILMNNAAAQNNAAYAGTASPIFGPYGPAGP